MNLKIVVYSSSKNQGHHIDRKYQTIVEHWPQTGEGRCTIATAGVFEALKLCMIKRPLYIRESLGLYPLIILLGLFRKRHVVIEVNGNPIFDRFGSTVARAVSPLRRAVLSLGFIRVIGYSIGALNGRPPKNFKLLNNFSSLAWRQVDTPRERNFYMFIGSSAKRHALPKLQYIAEELPDYMFYVIGNVGPEPAAENIAYLGHKTATELDAFEFSGYGIGSLAPDVVGWSSNSTLKGADYHALDLPFFQKIAEQNATESFCMVSLDPKDIREFCEAWRHKNIDNQTRAHFLPSHFCSQLRAEFEAR